MIDQLENQQTPEADMKAFRARWVIPISRPPIEDGIVTIEGTKIIRIEAVEDFRNTTRVAVTDLGNAIILPGFINLHTHLDQPPLDEAPRDFMTYWRAIRAYYQRVSPEAKGALVSENIQENLRFGTVALADFSRNGFTADYLLDSDLFARVFHEIEVFKEYLADTVLRRHQQLMMSFPATRQVTRHLAPASIWSLSPEMFRRVAVNERHIAIHMAMAEEEYNFIFYGKGPIRQFLLSGEDYDYSWQASNISPVKYFFQNRFDARHNIFVHAAYLDDDDIRMIRTSPSKVNICLCPRSNEQLSLGKAPVDSFLEKGINLCLGTESKAIVPDLDIRKEMVKCIDLYGISPESVVKFATLNGAYAVGFHKEVGSLEPGKSARCLVQPITGGSVRDPYEAVVSATDDVKWLI